MAKETPEKEKKNTVFSLPNYPPTSMQKILSVSDSTRVTRASVRDYQKREGNVNLRH